MQDNNSAPKNDLDSSNDTNNMFTSDTESSEFNGQESNELTSDYEWIASEFIDHAKNPGWYLLLALVVILVSVAVYFISGKGLFGPIIVVLSGVAFAVTGSRRPKNLTYRLISGGIDIDGKVYHYKEFKYYTVTQEGDNEVVNLIPLKRFSPPINLYIPIEFRNQALDIISTHLSFENSKNSLVDNFLNKIKF